jgi:hypothetical protein
MDIMFIIIVCIYMPGFILLAARCIYAYRKFEHYVKMNHPEKVYILKESIGQGHPWSPVSRWINSLLKNKDNEDQKLVCLAEAIRKTDKHLCFWFMTGPMFVLICIVIAYILYS